MSDDRELLKLAAKARDAAITQAARDVLDERRRQQEAEGWDTTHDDDLHEDGELAAAAAAYALHSTARLGASMPRPAFWPWDEQWWKPKGARRDLVRAGALILAEIERLDRSAMKGASDESGGEEAALARGSSILRTPRSLIGDHTLHGK